MAKNFPYFKFFPTEWLTGNIAYEDLEIQGLFINICSIYWQRDGNLSLDDIKRRYKKENLIDSLVTGGFIKLENELISIDFLNEQLEAANHISRKNSENGKKSAALKALKLKENSTSVETPLNESSTNKNKNKKESKEEVNTSKVETFDFDKLLLYINSSFKREFKIINQTVKKSFNARLKEGYSKIDIISCIDNLVQNKYHIENGFQYCTPEFLSRSSTLEKYSSKSNSVVKNDQPVQQQIKIGER